METEHVVGGVIVVVLAALLGSCVHDFAKSTPQVSEVTIVDKHDQPEYWTTDCTSDKGSTTCRPVYHAPSWSVRYEDGSERFSTSVSSGTYDALKLGERKVLRFSLGGGMWHARYSEQFVFGPVTGEASWSTR